MQNKEIYILSTTIILISLLALIAINECLKKRKKHIRAFENASDGIVFGYLAAFLILSTFYVKSSESNNKNTETAKTFLEDKKCKTKQSMQLKDNCYAQSITLAEIKSEKFKKQVIQEIKEEQQINIK